MALSATGAALTFLKAPVGMIGGEILIAVSPEAVTVSSMTTNCFLNARVALVTGLTANTSAISSTSPALSEDASQPSVDRYMYPVSLVASHVVDRTPSPAGASVTAEAVAAEPTIWVGTFCDM